MNVEAKLIIPTQDNEGNDMSNVVEQNILAMCKLYGGATVYEARGYWIGEGDRLYKDPVAVIISDAVNKTEAKDQLRALASKILSATDQEAVYISAGGETEIIE